MPRFDGIVSCPLLRATALGGLLLVAACASADDAPPSREESPPPAPIVSVMPGALPSLPSRPGVLARRVDIRRDTTTYGTGAAVVMLTSGDTVVVSDSAIRGWTLGDGSLVAVSGVDGAGGYENEGQSLTVISVSSGARRRVLADYYQIVRVELVADGGRAALLVHMRDGGQGSLHVAVVDPRRGTVFRSSNAIGRTANGRILVAGYGDSDTPVDFGDRRAPLRVDTLTTAAVDTLSLLVVPRSMP